MRELDRDTKNVVVLTDHVGNVDRYGSLVEDLGVNQAPSIVVVDRGGGLACSRATSTPRRSPR